jgi:PIN domain nuclease of toxin-antitoxin system
LSAAARRAIGDPANDRFLSIASLWEIAIKISNGKLILMGDLADAIDDIMATSLPITLAHLARL